MRVSFFPLVWTLELVMAQIVQFFAECLVLEVVHGAFVDALDPDAFVL
jgi:hypothetical protein